MLRFTKTKQMANDRLQFFTSRIGQRVYRNRLPYLDQSDLHNEKGLIVMSEKHAKGLYQLEQDELGIRYFDTKEEADKYEGE